MHRGPFSPIPLARGRRFGCLHHHWHYHKAVQIHHWGWSQDKARREKKKKKMEGKQYEDSSILSGSQGSLSAVLCPERVGFLLELWRYTPISKVYDSDLWVSLTSSQEIQEPKKKQESHWYWSLFKLWLPSHVHLLLLTSQGSQIVALCILCRVSVVISGRHGLSELTPPWMALEVLGILLMCVCMHDISTI